MEMYNVSELGTADTYLIQSTRSNPPLASPPLEQFEAMYNEGVPEFVVEQGLYYPTATNYGYICTGFDSPGDWDDHHRIFGLDGQEIQYGGAQTENFPYVYYSPSYGYAQSPFNPYNPYIPGAMVGLDGSFVGSQQYYSIPSYENPVSSPAYFPMLIQSRPDIISNSTNDALLDATTFNSNRADGPSPKYNPSSSSKTFTPNPAKPASNQAHSFTRMPEGPKANPGSSKQPATHGSVTSGRFSSLASSQFIQGSAQAVDNVSHGKDLSHRNLLKLSLPSSNGLSNFGSSAHGRATGDKVWSKFSYGRVQSNVNGSPDALTEQNRGPRTNKPKHHLAAKDYTNTTGAGNSGTQGNVIIYTDQFNKDNFHVDHANSKFFVIKSYSEDDVHKSIKYNVWSSTPNGNKKLNSAYADAQKLAAGESKGCPVFLFFSVNASGHFCGVAEMTGPVDFHKDVDFWQQDKWSGSFPVKWHIIKDVPNPNFRHIILENNENKPVTNSRDTQEIRYKAGMEMLRTFKNYTSKTSLLDDFMYYENRQKIMQEEKTRLLIKSYGSAFLVPTLGPPRKLNQVVDSLPAEGGKIVKHNVMNSVEKTTGSPAEYVLLDSKVSDTNTAKENDNPTENEVKDDNSSLLKIGSLTINPKQDESKSLEAANFTATAITNSTSSASSVTLMETKPINVVTVGSIPVKVNGFSESSGLLTVGTIPLDPRALQLGEAAGFIKSG